MFVHRIGANRHSAISYRCILIYEDSGLPEWVSQILQLLADLFLWAMSIVGAVIMWLLSAPVFAVTHWFWFFEIYPVQYWQELSSGQHLLYAVGYHLTAPFSLYIYWVFIKAGWQTFREKGGQQQGQP